ncbi:hypothetical protein EJB05_45025, partial [Eragrostis curvula]
MSGRYFTLSIMVFGRGRVASRAVSRPVFGRGRVASRAVSRPGRGLRWERPSSGGVESGTALVVAPLSPTLRVEVDIGMASFPLVGQPTGRLRSDLLPSPHLHGFGCGFLLYRERVR